MGGGDELHDLPDLSKLLNDGIVHILPPAEPRLHGKVLSSGSSDVSLGSKDPRVKKHTGALHVILLGFRAVSLSEIGINASATLGAWSLP